MNAPRRNGLAFRSCNTFDGDGDATAGATGDGDATGGRTGGPEMATVIPICHPI